MGLLWELSRGALHGSRAELKVKTLPSATCMCRVSKQGYHFAAAVEMEVGEDGKKAVPKLN